jgi:hypothetical protein
VNVAGAETSGVPVVRASVRDVLAVAVVETVEFAREGEGDEDDVIIRDLVRSADADAVSRSNALTDAPADTLPPPPPPPPTIDRDDKGENDAREETVMPETVEVTEVFELRVDVVLRVEFATVPVGVPVIVALRRDDNEGEFERELREVTLDEREANDGDDVSEILAVLEALIETLGVLLLLAVRLKILDAERERVIFGVRVVVVVEVVVRDVDAEAVTDVFAE